MGCTPSDMEKTTATSDAPAHGTSTKHKASSAAAGSATASGASSPRLVVVSPKGGGDAGGGRSSDRGRVDDGAETQHPAKAGDSTLPHSSGSLKGASTAAEAVTPPPAAAPVPKSRKAKAVEFLAGFFSGNFSLDCDTLPKGIRVQARAAGHHRAQSSTHCRLLVPD